MGSNPLKGGGAHLLAENLPADNNLKEFHLFGIGMREAAKRTFKYHPHLQNAERVSV